MNWSPRYIDHPLRILFEGETWVVVFVVLGIEVFVLGMNQAIAMIGGLVVGFILQKIVDTERPGYLIHLFHRLRIIRLFPCGYGRYRF